MPKRCPVSDHATAELAALRELVEAVQSGEGEFNRSRVASLGANFSREDFIANCPFTTKKEIAEDHAANAPFGSNLTRPLSDYPRLCRTSGTAGAPLTWLDTAGDWASMLDVWEAIYRAAGVEPGRDRVYFAFSFGPFLGFWTAYDAVARMGCMAIPGGGLSSEARLSAIRELGATVLCCTPTYALRLGEAKEGALGVKTIIVAGEPGGSVPAVREAISTLWDGAHVVDHHGMTEVGPVSVEPPDAPGNLCAIPGAHLVEVIGSESGGEVDEGEEGELVLTTLRRPGHPLLRYRTGDLVRKRFFEFGGEQAIGFEGGILGRADDMVVVRGVNIYPAAVDAVLRRFDEVAEYQVLRTRERAMDEIRVRVELTPGTQVALVEEVAMALREAFSLRIPVELAAEGELPRFEFKAKRWVHVD